MNIIEMAKQLVAGAGKNPIGLALAVIALAILGAGKTMTENQIEPWGTLVSGIGALIVIVAGLWMKAHQPKEPPPAEQPPTEPPK